MAEGTTILKRYYPKGEQRIGDADAGLYTYRTDHLGSIREVVDSTGTLTARYDYDAWGVLETVSGSFNLDFGYTGHFIHHPSGLHLAPFRAYDPTLGRWIGREHIDLRTHIGLDAHRRYFLCLRVDTN